MRASVLADTGALLAFLDRDEPWHHACSEAFQQLRLPLLTSQAVLTELLYLIGSNPRDLQTAWTFIHSGALTLGEITDGDLQGLHILMDRYADRPMDFADATLVHLANRESIATVFTIDFADFQTYRLDKRRRFRIFPQPAGL